ncbi:TIGR04282 family arsenosugar biosynthesis glycosyltransferase [Peijinzhouia sedimentorum]
MAKSGLIIFVKSPIAGEVKTRLAADIGDEKALEIYWQLLQITKKVALQFNGSKMIWSNKDWIDNSDFWPIEAFQFHLQKGSSLGEKMAQAFEFHFKESFTKLILIGSDCPEINILILNEAEQALDHHDLVIGPAADGGYYLIAMKEVHYELFQNMEWSHAQVLEQSLQRAKSKSLSIHMLQTLSDIDNVADLNLLPNEFGATKN